jgi:ribosome-associated heat shock protein Hsp15
MDGLRIDKWLWFARLVKSRSLAQTLIDEGEIMLNGRPVLKASTTVKAGDRIIVTVRERQRCFVVRALADRRGPFSEAILLYQEFAAEPAAVQTMLSNP